MRNKNGSVRVPLSEIQAVGTDSSGCTSSHIAVTVNEPFSSISSCCQVQQSQQARAQTGESIRAYQEDLAASLVSLLEQVLLQFRFHRLDRRRRDASGNDVLERLIVEAQDLLHTSPLAACSGVDRCDKIRLTCGRPEM